MQIYLVGGAVRDMVLGINPHDKDYVVIGATPKEMLSLGYKQVGKDFPVFLHPQTKSEYALARKEILTGSKHQDFHFEFTPEITLKEDLIRRDFTCNALAYDEENQKLIDLFGGVKDIKNHILRHISTHFKEDPLRVLRACRFAAQLNFTIAPQTNTLIKQMIADNALQNLSIERIWQEFFKALSTPDFAVFIQTLQDCGGLSKLIPETQNYTLDELIKPLLNTRNLSPKTKFAVFVFGFTASACNHLKPPADFKKFALLCEKRCRNINHLSINNLEELVDTINDLSSHCRNFSLIQEVFDVCRCRASDEDLIKKPYELCQQAYNIISTITAPQLPDFNNLKGKEISHTLRNAQITALQNYFKS